MKKTLLIVVSLLSFTTMLRAQHAVSSATWETLNTFTIITQNNKLVTYYPPALKSLDTKTVELPGYIVPIKAGATHKEFMLSVLPVEQCAFCGSGDCPPMVLIRLSKPVSYTPSLVFVKGKLLLNKLNDNQPEFTVTDASITR